MSTNPHSIARDSAVQFLYQCESEKLYYFSQSHCDMFLTHFSVDFSANKYFLEIVNGVLEDIAKLDEVIAKHSKNWSVSRMAATDRAILRIAIWELEQKNEPRKVVMNEAIDLAKKYGTEHSSAFVNGILDAVCAGN